MKFYRNSDLTNFIATDDTMSVIITKSQFVNSFVVYFIPFRKKDGEVYEDSTHDEFFAEYDTLTSFMTMVDETKVKNGKGLGALLPDAKENSYK